MFELYIILLRGVNTFMYKSIYTTVCWWSIFVISTPSRVGSSCVLTFPCVQRRWQTHVLRSDTVGPTGSYVTENDGGNANWYDEKSREIAFQIGFMYAGDKFCIKKNYVYYYYYFIYVYYMYECPNYYVSRLF